MTNSAAAGACSGFRVGVKAPHWLTVAVATGFIDHLSAGVLLLFIDCVCVSCDGVRRAPTHRRRLTFSLLFNPTPRVNNRFLFFTFRMKYEYEEGPTRDTYNVHCIRVAYL